MRADEKYRSYPPVPMPDRQWPSQVITRAPVWCSVDLRDGNQALVEPMDAARKHRMFEHLVRLGFKEIEVGFPSASQTDYDFVRQLIESGAVPEDVTLQVLTPAREAFIARTFEALAGARRAIVHLYNSTSTLQRRVVFGRDRDGITELTVQGARWVAEQAAARPQTEWVFEYSPESFTGTELDYAVEICEAVCDVWQPTPERKVILNLPATVEMATPNVFADQIEWFGRHFSRRDAVVLSVHPHNDRGTAVAATELALLAGADRVEGTLFGNGERTGNTDLVTLALNLYTQGVEPGIDLSDIDAVVRTYEHCTRMPVPARQPYAGELVYTAFSGSHQDAIKKGLAAREGAHWEVPYLPIDPSDVGRGYDGLIRVNSQSGKGGVAYLLERDHGLEMPRGLQVEFSNRVQQETDSRGGELDSGALWRLFAEEYLTAEQPYGYIAHQESAQGRFAFTVKSERRVRQWLATGNGPVDGLVAALNRESGLGIDVVDYHEHSLGEGAAARAVAYVQLSARDGSRCYGVAIDANIVRASLRAVIVGVNRILAARRHAA